MHFRSLLTCLCLTSTVSLASPQIDVLDSFAVNEGLKAVLWADSNLVHSPIAMDVDAQGRVWVTEDLQHSGIKGAPHARIQILEDSDLDGKADKVSSFGPTFRSKPMGITVFDNRIVVSMAPAIHVYTDVNRDGVFDPAVDKEETIATGFHGQGHDHALHKVVPGPSGKWYVNHGNIGADVTMPDGRKIHASSYYSDNRQSLGRKSYDGRMVIGGFGLRMDPDGRNASVIFQNTRNTHAMVVTSFGDVLHADNDDPSHARACWAMEFSNYGYASLEDGSRSWEDAAKSWEKKLVTEDIVQAAYNQSKHVLRRDEGHWRQNFPGVTPPGYVWGAGAPTGDYFVEGDELGRNLRGKYLMCESVHRAVFAFEPVLRDAQIELVDLNKSFFAANRKSADSFVSAFLPTDICAAPDGALFVSDWNSVVNRRGRGNKEGGIYRLSRADETKVTLPVVDFETLDGLIDALKSPVPGVRWVAQNKLKHAAGATAALVRLIGATENPYYKARALFVLAQLDDGQAEKAVQEQLASEDEQERIVAFRALRMAGRVPLLPVINQLADDPSAAVRREVSHALRDLPYELAKQALDKLIKGYDGKNRWYLEAIGAAVDGRSDQVYDELVRPGQSDPAKWNEREMNLAWRLRSKRALRDLADSMMAQNVSEDLFRRLAYTYGLCFTKEERAQNEAIMDRFRSHPAFAGESYQLTIQEFLDKDILDPSPEALTTSYVFPEVYAEASDPGQLDEIMKLAPDARKGKEKAAACMMCHVIGETGAPFGPDLTSWGQSQDAATVIRAMLSPASELAHGYEKAVVVEQNGHRLEGIQTGYSYHAGAARVKTVGGKSVKFPFRRPRAKITQLKNHSWMPSAADLGLTSQNVRDIAAYLMLSHDERNRLDKAE